jgi:hypothetical protein
LRQAKIDRRDKKFQEICQDVLSSTRSRSFRTETQQVNLAQQTIPITIGVAVPQQPVRRAAPKAPKPVPTGRLVEQLIKRHC